MSGADFHALLREAIGLEPASIGPAAVDRAVQARMAAGGHGDAGAYRALLEASPAELQALVEAVVVPETWFFRDPEAFAALARVAVARPAGAGALRVLSLPCSTGEEPYSIAMALLDAGVAADGFRIEAMDISARVLAVAARGIYGRNAFRGGALEFRDRHFVAVRDGMRLDERVRERVRFRQGNIFAAGFELEAGGFDAIFCRNLLIYFDRPTQDRALGVLERLLAPGGLMFVGPSETGLLMSHGFASAQWPLAFAFRRPVAGVAMPAVPAPRVRPRAVVPVARPVVSRPVVRPVVRPLVRQEAPAVVAPAVDGLAEAGRLADQGALEEAARRCEAHLRAHGASADGFALMGLIRDAGGAAAEAAALYRKALYLDRGHAGALSHLALLLERQGDPAGARLLRERARRGGGG